LQHRDREQLGIQRAGIIETGTESFRPRATKRRRTS
jgi:hypothetical protein